MKPIGPSFYSELQAAGLAGLPFSYSADGTIYFDPAMTQDQIAAVEAVYAAHDPTKPAPPQVPARVTRFQARAALLSANLLDTVDAYFAGLPEDNLDRLAWDEAPTVDRDSDATKGAAQSLGLTDAQVDLLFINAANY